MGALGKGGKGGKGEAGRGAEENVELNRNQFNKWTHVYHWPGPSLISASIFCGYSSGIKGRNSSGENSN